MPREQDEFAGLRREFRTVPHHEPTAFVLHAAEDVRGVAAFSLRNGRGFASESNRDFHDLATCLDIDPTSIVVPRQVHGNKAKIVESPRSQPGAADALITPVSGIFLAVQTADCVPVVLLDAEKKIAAAVHAGWKGTLFRIVRTTIRIMNEQFGSDPSHLVAAMGPSIGPCCYEVGDDVVNAYHKEFPSAGSFIVSGSEAASRASFVNLPQVGIVHAAPIPGKRSISASRRLDLGGINRMELKDAGVQARNIHVIGLCTACYSELFYSHRRDRGNTGRHIAVAGFRA